MTDCLLTYGDTDVIT